jgi:intracellular septation protein A
VNEAKFGDEVRLEVELVEYKDQFIAWQTTIANAITGAVFTQNYAIYEVKESNLLNKILQKES